jgi:hypothetical protein
MQVSRIKLVIKSLAIKYTKIAYKVLMLGKLQNGVRYHLSYQHRGGLPQRHGRRAQKIRLKDGRVIIWSDAAVTERIGFDEAITRAHQEGAQAAELIAMGLIVTTCLTLYRDEDEEETYSLVVNNPDALPVTILWVAYSRDGGARQTFNMYFTTTIEMKDGQMVKTGDNPKI